MNHNPEKPWSACLFPHTHASDGEIRKVLSFFDSLTVFRPWHMEGRLPPSPEAALVRVLRPPERLRPVGEFPSLLSQYKDWVKHTPGGYLTSLSAIGKYRESEASTWELRRAIRSGDGAGDEAEPAATRYHLLLHLARETEESRREAGEILWALRGREGPLRGLVEGEEPVSILRDLPHFDDGMEMGESFLERVVEAWFGLFGAYLAEDERLLTTDPGVRSFLVALWGEFRPSDRAVGCDLHLEWPDLSSLDAVHFLAGREELFGTTREAVGGLLDPDRGGTAAAAERSKRALEGFSRNHAGGAGKVLFTVNHFPACPDPLPNGPGAVLNKLSGKTLFFLQGGV